MFKICSHESISLLSSSRLSSINPLRTGCVQIYTTGLSLPSRSCSCGLRRVRYQCNLVFICFLSIAKKKLQKDIVVIVYQEDYPDICSICSCFMREVAWVLQPLQSSEVFISTFLVAGSMTSCSEWSKTKQTAKMTVVSVLHRETEYQN